MVFVIELGGGTVTSSAPDPPKPGSTTSTTFTAHLATKHATVVL